MRVKTTYGPIAILPISSDVDSTTHSAMVDQAARLLDTGHARLILDLGGVEYLSGAGLLALQTIANQAAARRGRMALCRPRRHVSAKPHAR